MKKAIAGIITILIIITIIICNIPLDKYKSSLSTYGYYKTNIKEINNQTGETDLDMKYHVIVFDASKLKSTQSTKPNKELYLADSTWISNNYALDTLNDHKHTFAEGFIEDLLIENNKPMISFNANQYYFGRYITKDLDNNSVNTDIFDENAHIVIGNDNLAKTDYEDLKKTIKYVELSIYDATSKTITYIELTNK